MKQVKVFLTMALALFVLAGSAGLYVFEHTCKMEGKDKHLYIPVQHACAMDIELDVESCCQSSNPSNEQEGCCDDQVEVIQIAYDYVNPLPDFHFIADYVDISNWGIYTLFTPVEHASKISFSDSFPPLLLSGREKGILYQVFRC